jgi:hypothetical protein
MKHKRGCYVLESGHDPNPAWDYVCEVVWKTTARKHTKRETVADIFMWASNDDLLMMSNPDTAVMLGRMAMALVGKDWCDEWLYDHYAKLNKKNRSQKMWYEGIAKRIGGFFSDNKAR